MFQIDYLSEDERKFLTAAAEAAPVRGKEAYIAASALQKLYGAAEVEVQVKAKGKKE